MRGVLVVLAGRDEDEALSLRHSTDPTGRPERSLAVTPSGRCPTMRSHGTQYGAVLAVTG